MRTGRQGAGFAWVSPVQLRLPVLHTPVLPTSGHPSSSLLACLLAKHKRPPAPPPPCATQCPRPVPLPSTMFLIMRPVPELVGFREPQEHRLPCRCRACMTARCAARHGTWRHAERFHFLLPPLEPGATRTLNIEVRCGGCVCVCVVVGGGPVGGEG